MFLLTASVGLELTAWTPNWISAMSGLALAVPEPVTLMIGVMAVSGIVPVLLVVQLNKNRDINIEKMTNFIFIEVSILNL